VVRLRNMPFPASFRSFAAHEAEAVALNTYQHSLVPGLLQTEDYARAILATRPNTTADEVAEQVRGRLDRQAVLTRNDPPAPLLRFKSLQSEALPKGASRDLIARVAEQRWTDQAR
jgi:Domain of unknown function (DUF5753)